MVVCCHGYIIVPGLAQGVLAVTIAGVKPEGKINSGEFFPEGEGLVHFIT